VGVKLCSIENLKREIKLQKKMIHQNICKLFSFFEDKQNVYLVLEYCEKGNLFQILKKSQFFLEKTAFAFFFKHVWLLIIYIKMIQYIEIQNQKIYYQILKIYQKFVILVQAQKEQMKELHFVVLQIIWLLKQRQEFPMIIVQIYGLWEYFYMNQLMVKLLFMIIIFIRNKI
ncbi:protein kinase domain protein, partial [Ichthyophthirius multifiliis]